MEYVINVNGANIELQEAIPEGFPKDPSYAVSHVCKWIVEPIACDLHV